MPENLPAILSPPPADCLAFIIGPNHFQNSLLTAYIDTHSEWKSCVIDSVSAMGCRKGGAPRHIAVLSDCFGLGRNELENTLVAKLEELPPGWALVLFNLDRRTGVEKRALQYGVQGFFYADEPAETLLKGLAAVFGGEFWVSRQKMAEVILENGLGLRRKQAPRRDYPHDLTRREVEILGMLNLGANNEVIAQKLFISPNTVRTHLNHIFKKMKVSSRLEASISAAETLFANGAIEGPGIIATLPVKTQP